MKFKLLFIFTLIFSALPLCAITQERLNKQFIDAIILNHIEEVASCLIRGMDVNAAIYDEWINSNCTGLMQAAKYGHIEIVNLLLDHGAQVNLVDSFFGYTALIFAASNGHTKVAQVLLNHHADVNIGNNEAQTALMRASENGHLKTVKLLLEYDAHINARDKKDQTALHYAISKNHHKIVKLFLEKNASLYTPFTTFTNVLHYAVSKNYSTIVNILLRHSQYIDIHIKDDFESTPLTFAATSSKCKSVELLLKYIIHRLDKITSPRVCHMWDQYILEALKYTSIYDNIDVINAFRILLHHADKLPLSTKKFESITAKALGRHPFSERSFRKTVEHIRKSAF